MQPGFDSTHRHAYKLLNFREFVAFRVVQKHYQPMFVAELLQRRVKLLHFLESLVVERRILGTREPFEAIARRYLAEPDLIAPGLNAGSKLGAFGFLVRMFMTPVPDLDRWERGQGLPILRDPVPAMNSPEWSASAAGGSILLNADPVARDERPG